MSILTELRAALEGKREAAALVETRRLQSSRSCSPAFVDRRESLLAHYRLHALLTDDTIRALLDVAEAAQAVVEYIDQDYFTVDEEKVVVALIAALAPLTKEADSE